MGGDKRCGQNGRHGRQDNVRRERIVQAHPADVVVLPAPLGGSALVQHGLLKQQVLDGGFLAVSHSMCSIATPPGTGRQPCRDVPL